MLTPEQRLDATKFLLERMGWTDLEVKDIGHRDRLYGSSPIKETTELFEKATGRSVEPFQWTDQIPPDPFTSADAFDSVKKAMTEEERLNYYNNLFTAFDRFKSGQSIYYGFSFSYWLEFDCELSLKAETAAKAMGYTAAQAAKAAKEEG